MRIRDLIPRPQPHGYLGLRMLGAFLAVILLGIVLYLLGAITTNGVARGVGLLFVLLGIVNTLGLLLRWLIFRRIT